MKKILFIFVFLFVSLYAVNLKTGAPIREEAKKGVSEPVAIAVKSMDFAVIKTFSYWTKVTVVKGLDGDGNDVSGKVGWIYTPLLTSNKVGGVGATVRDKSSGRSDEVCTVRSGSTIKILDSDKTWFYVSDDNGISGWTWEENILTE